jgi:uncharacterized membrane protein
VTLLWAAALPAAAFGASTGDAPWSGLAAAVYALGHAICHQRPERSFFWGEVAWPVCARCTGIYMGAAAGVLIGLMVRTAAEVPAARVRVWLVTAVVPASVSLAYEWGSGRMPSNATRSGTGAIVGLTTACLLVMFLRQPAATARAARKPEVN